MYRCHRVDLVVAVLVVVSFVIGVTVVVASVAVLVVVGVMVAVESLECSLLLSSSSLFRCG